jgi:hypothetical protein
MWFRAGPAQAFQHRFGPEQMLRRAIMNSPTTNSAATTDSVRHGESLDHPRSRAAFRSVKRLIGGYLALSVLALAAIILMRNNTAEVNDTVWVRGTIVVGSALLMTSFAARAAGGSARAYLRLRIVSAAMVMAIAVIISLPGFLPVWMRIEQGVCGLLLIGVVMVVNGRHLRSVFASR